VEPVLELVRNRFRNQTARLRRRTRANARSVPKSERASKTSA
jgi:hypothetical protein